MHNGRTSKPPMALGAVAKAVVNSNQPVNWEGLVQTLEAAGAINRLQKYHALNAKNLDGFANASPSVIAASLLWFDAEQSERFRLNATSEQASAAQTLFDAYAKTGYPALGSNQINHLAMLQDDPCDGLYREITNDWGIYQGDSLPDSQCMVDTLVKRRSKHSESGYLFTIDGQMDGNELVAAYKHAVGLFGGRPSFNNADWLLASDAYESEHTNQLIKAGHTEVMMQNKMMPLYLASNHKVAGGQQQKKQMNQLKLG